MEPTEKHIYWRSIRATFHDLPAWQKVIAVTACLFISPAIVLVAVLFGLSLLPLVLLGKYEGSTNASMTTEIAEGIRHRKERVARMYAH